MKEKKELENKNDFYLDETTYDKGLMEKEDERRKYLENSPATKAIVSAATTFKQSQTGMDSYYNSLKLNASAVIATKSLANVACAIGKDYAADSVLSSLGVMSKAVKKSQCDFYFNNSGFCAALNTATKTPEILKLQRQLKNSTLSRENGIEAISDYVGNFTSQWNSSFVFRNVTERSIAAQNFALLRILPDYDKLNLPRGSKSILRTLTKTTAEKLMKTEEILFDPKEKDFYHKDTPEQKLTAEQISIAESSQDLFADISLDELVSFESQLYADVTFAICHPVGKKIFEIINGWKNFISFDDDIYYHARRIETGQAPFLDQEMLRAPLNISAHGRYNAIGKSCYYIAETKEGALAEITKHSGGKKSSIQVVGLKPVKKARIIDLSGEVKGNNRFIEHLRFTVENEDGKIVKKYLLPNFVASCCKKIGIDGIKYRSTGYNCCVLWKDDYFEFVEGSREIVSEV